MKKTGKKPGKKPECGAVRGGADKKTTVLQNSLIWFGAAVSLAEILTGTYFAPLGMAKGCAAIVLGHAIGCMLLFFAGCIGGKTGRSAMETVKMSFGRRGGLLFAVLNILQLAGWTSIMIYDGAAACNGVFPAGRWVWCMVIGALIVLWILIGVTNLGWVNQVTMAALFFLTLVLCRLIFSGGAPVAGGTARAMSFGAAVELAVAMPLSWLPLISDYTRQAEKPVAATLGSVVTYGLVSCWMYIIGMGAAVYTGENDIAVIMVKAGLGAAALGILILSTVTTTFLDAYSAGVSGESLSGRIDARKAGVAVTVLGAVAAILFPMDNITGFLYLIGSVFAPMIAIQIADFFLLGKAPCSSAFHWGNLLLWAVGFCLYRLLMRVDTPLGSTLPDMAITAAICLAAAKLAPKVKTEAANIEDESGI